MIRVIAAAVCGASVVIAGLAGCSGTKKAEEKSPAATTGGVSASTGAGSATVIIDGQQQDIGGQVVCATTGDSLTIGIGEQGSGIAVVMSADASKVTSVGLGDLNGVALAYQDGAPGASATATKDGKNYTISGTAIGVNMADPMQPVNEPFEIKVSCP